MSKPRSKKRFTVDIDPDIHRRLKRAAAHFGVPAQQLADSKLNIGLAEDEKVMRKEFNKTPASSTAS